jgi:hypothetical protein
VYFKGKIANLKKTRIISFGINQMGDDEGIKPGIHAEVDALSKLEPLKSKKHMEKINILVIRISKKNILQSSKPCNNCIKAMNILPSKKGYQLQDIYYSDGEGRIVKSNLTYLENSEKHISQFYRKRTHKNNNE